jgi:hypothetical protein
VPLVNQLLLVREEISLLCQLCTGHHARAVTAHGSAGVSDSSAALTQRPPPGGRKSLRDTQWLRKLQ